METIIAGAPCKYNIEVRLNRLEKRKRLSIRHCIMKKTGVVASTYFRWLDLRQGDSGDIPGEALILFATLLSVSANELLNKPAEPC